jgi:hypothetical protein
MVNGTDGRLSSSRDIMKIKSIIPKVVEENVIFILSNNNRNKQPNFDINIIGKNIGNDRIF